MPIPGSRFATILYNGSDFTLAQKRLTTSIESYLYIYFLISMNTSTLIYSLFNELIGYI